jgi:hypothetical protein
MKLIGKSLVIAAAAFALTAGTQSTFAQRGNFDPAQMQEMMMTRYRESLEVTDDAEWKLVAERITKVTTARQAVPQGRGGFGGGGRGGRGGQQPADGAAPQGGRRGGGGGFGGTPNPDMEALQKAIEDKAPADDIKAKLAKVRASTTAANAALDAAQAELKKVLTARQEAIAVTLGLLK